VFVCVVRQCTTNTSRTMP